MPRRKNTMKASITVKDQGWLFKSLLALWYFDSYIGLTSRVFVWQSLRRALLRVSLTDTSFRPCVCEALTAKLFSAQRKSQWKPDKLLKAIE
jgi:hypothetical protein